MFAINNDNNNNNNNNNNSNKICSTDYHLEEYKCLLLELTQASYVVAGMG